MDIIINIIGYIANIGFTLAYFFFARKKISFIWYHGINAIIGIMSATYVVYNGTYAALLSNIPFTIIAFHTFLNKRKKVNKHAY